MKATLFNSFIIFILCSCSKPMYYSYRTSMVPSSVSDSLIYENDSLKVRFDLYPKYLKLKLDNKLSDAIQIKWDEAAMSINGTSHRIVHKETGIYKTTDMQPSTSVPPHSYLIDEYITTNQIIHSSSIVTGASLVNVETIFPDYNYGNKRISQKIKKLKGTTLVVYMPMYVSGKYIAKSFQIRINDIIESKRKP